VDCFWYKPASNTQARKLTYVRKVQSRSGTFIVGAGLYAEPESPAIEQP
jgi:signal transduction histidine kinase